CKGSVMAPVSVRHRRNGVILKCTRRGAAITTVKAMEPSLPIWQFWGPTGRVARQGEPPVAGYSGRRCCGEKLPDHVGTWLRPTCFVTRDVLRNVNPDPLVLQRLTRPIPFRVFHNASTPPGAEGARGLLT